MFSPSEPRVVLPYSMHQYGVCYTILAPSLDETPPTINSISYKFKPPDTLTLVVNATDPSGIARVYATVEGSRYTLVLMDGLYTVNITCGLLSKINSLLVDVYAVDNYNNTVRVELRVAPTTEEKLLSIAITNNISEAVASEFYKQYTSLVEALLPDNAGLLTPPLKLYNANKTVFGTLYHNIMGDPQVKMDKFKLASYTSKLFLQLGYTGWVKVEIPGSSNYTMEPLSRETIQALANYSIAVYQLHLPIHDENTLYLLGNATQINPAIVDFKPIIIKDYLGTTHIIKSSNIARDTWMIVEHLKYTPT